MHVRVHRCLLPMCHANHMFCCVCQKSFVNARKLATHKWSEHKIKSEIRCLVADVSVCPVCHVDFISHSRLKKHLMEKRVRSKIRSCSCRQAFLDSNPEPVAPELLKQLETQFVQEKKKARQAGHTNVLARVPCKPSKPSVLKGIKSGISPQSKKEPHLRAKRAPRQRPTVKTATKSESTAFVRRRINKKRPALGTAYYCKDSSKHPISPLHSSFP